jgi:hypothetical protein
MSYDGALGPALVIQHTGQVFPLTQQPVTIGRGAANTLILADPEVSGNHATIFWQADLDLFVIQDVGSANGTFVNGHRIIEPQPLRDGDLVQTGNTLIDVRLQRVHKTPALAPASFGIPANEHQPAPGSGNRLVLPGIIITLLTGITIACLIIFLVIILGRGKGVPTVIVQSPPDGAQVYTGREVILQATASGASDITLLELSVDGSVVAIASSPDPDGRSTLSVSKGWTFVETGEHSVSAVAYTAGGKTSRTEAIEVQGVQSAAGVQPGATALATPIVQATSTPTAKPEAPVIEYLRANPEAINAGECATLEWGTVTGATEAKIDPGLGGVGTPGSQEVCPIDTTTYVLTATGPGGTTTAATTVTVTGELADLLVVSVGYSPNPPVQAQDTSVEITVRNAGPGEAGPFNWDWQAGPDTQFNGRLGGLGAGQTTVVAVRWRPPQAYASLSTVARVDTSNEVPETDKGNNQLVSVVQVIPGPPGPGTATQQSEPDLDGYRGSTGGGGTGQDIIVGNGGQTGPSGEKVWRGFMSFDLSDIPSGASIEGARLRFYQVKVEGSPYQKMGSLILDHVDYGSKLSRATYDTPSLGSATLAQQPSPGTWYNIVDQPIADWVEQDLSAGRDRFQVRLRWARETDGDDQEDYASMEPGNNYFGTGNVPVLVVTYGP